jgi:hypothetical protein
MADGCSCWCTARISSADPGLASCVLALIPCYSWVFSRE